MMDRGEHGIAEEMLRAVSSYRGIRKNLSLIVDVLHALTGKPCSAFLLSTRESLVCWEHSKGWKADEGPSLRLTPYRLDAVEMRMFEGWETRGGSLRLLRSLDDEISLVLRLKTGGALDDASAVRDIVDGVLPAVIGYYRREKNKRERAEDRQAEHIAKTVGGLGDKRKAMRLLAAAVCKSTEAERAAILGYSDREEALWVIAAYGRMKESPSFSRPIRLGEGVAGWCLLNRKTANLADARSDPRYIKGAYDDIRTMLCVPVLEEGRPRGAICAVNRIWPYSGISPGFKLADQRFLEKLSRETTTLFRSV